MTTNIFGATALSGGTDGAIDTIKVANIADGDIVFTVDSTEEFLALRYESSNDNVTNPEVSPKVIVPNDNTSGTGAWILLDQTQDVFTVYGGIIMIDGKSILWDVIPVADHTVSGDTESGTAGENLVFGDMCYFKSDGKFWKADADAAGTVPVVAMSTATILADASGIFLTRGIARDDTLTNTVGGKIYASTTAGGQTQTAPSGSGDQVQAIGRATHADYFKFEPSLDVLELI